MKKTKIFFFIFLISISNLVHSEEKKEIFDGKGGRENDTFLKSKNSNFIKGNTSLKKALKFIKKNKIKKANKRLEKAVNYFNLAYKETPDNLDLLNLLGFSYFLLGDTIMSEIYYLQGLDIFYCCIAIKYCSCKYW